MKRFSKTAPITKTNLKKVPKSKPGVYRIKSKKNEILFIGLARGGHLDDRIYEHRGLFISGTKFQYRTTPSEKAAERLEKKRNHESYA